VSIRGLDFPALTIAGFYRYAVREDRLDQPPTAHSRRRHPDMSRMPPGWTQDPVTTIVIVAVGAGPVRNADRLAQ
jgi:hypothetical protein